MSLAGVRSNRGDSYQTLVAFEWALSVLSSDKYQWIEVDSTSPDASGSPMSVDDVVVGLADGSIICCQCKKNQQDFKAWSASDLREELNKAAQFMVNHSKSRVIFYTRGNFGDLAKLREHAATQPDDAAYQTSLTLNHRKTDADLTKYTSCISRISTYELLRRTTFETSPELGRMEELLMERLSRLVSNADNAFHALWTKLDMLGARIAGNGNTEAQPFHRLTKADLQEILAKSGATFLPPLSQQKMQELFASASVIGRNWRRDIAGKRLQVASVNDLISAIDAKEHSVLLAGVPGSGKTCVLLELQEALEKRHDLSAIFIQAREYANCSTPEARTSHGLPENLIGLIGRMADCKQTVVIIDSLDVLSLSREHTVLAFFLAQIDRLLLIPNVTVIAACRDFDRKYDRRLAERTWDRIVSNIPLDWVAVVAPLISNYGIDPESLDTTTRNLLQNPRELALFTDIAQHTGGFNVATSQALSRKYLETIVQGDPVLGDAAMVAIEQIAQKMLTSRRLDVSRVQAPISDEMLNRLFSAAVLHKNQSGNIEFGHQTLLDVLVVSGAERSELSLKDFIESLPAVPFVRPTIRAYATYLAAGDRLSFRKQLRAVFDSDAAFHIRRLVAESFADQIPQDDDWSLIKHLHCRHRELFNSLYIKADSLEWHNFWLRVFVPYVLEERDAQSLATHARRIAFWKKVDPSGVINFWTDALKQDWADRNQIARTLAFELRDFDSKAKVITAPLIEMLLILPRQDYDMLGHAVAQCIETGGGGDELLWRYITGDIGEEDILKYSFDQKLKCDLHEFGNNDFFYRRMLESERLLELAINSVEQWSLIRGAKYNITDRDWYEGFLQETTYHESHSRQDTRYTSAENVLFQALEDAILYHAKEHTEWWINHRQRICRSHEGALRYFAILALTISPEHNIVEVECLVTDKRMLESSLIYEIGTLLNASFLYLKEQVQDIVLSILALRDDEESKKNPRILTARAELLSVIPAHLRSPEAQAALVFWKNVFGLCIRQPHISSWGGLVAAPFSYQLFQESTDASVLKILSYYEQDGRSNWEYVFLIGGAEQVEWQLREATSRSPVRFMSLLIENWVDIPNRFTDDILNGAATYLAHRFGNLNFDANQWQYIEEPNPQALASLILDEIERHPVRWHHCHATANALEACANVVEDELNASRLLFASIGFLNYRERESDSYSANLIDVGINMSRGKVAEAVIIIATRWAEKRWQFPELLVPTLRRFACDPNPAVRASILRRLHYFQSHAPELGWEIFHLAMEESDERLWEIAEPCLYYNYHNQFEQVSIILDRIVSSATEKELESWGRISALAAFLGYVDINDFVDRLTLLANADAWKGAASVWTHHENVMQYRNQCFLGLMTGLQQSDEVTSSIATEMASLFQKSEPITSISREIVNLYFSAIEQKKDDGRFNLYGLDDWLNATSLNRPDDALAAAERFADFVLRTKHHLHDFGAFSQLLTRLFREAEEREESDGGTMLRRVIALQDGFLATGVNGLQDWLRDAERP